MKTLRIREHLKMLLKIRANWDRYINQSTVSHADTIRIITQHGWLHLNRLELENHIKRTKLNLDKYSK